jgi:hypothetical protein
MLMSATNMLITQPSSAPRSVAPSSVPRRRHGVRVVPTHHVPRRHNLWRRAVLPRRHRLWRRAKGPKMLLKFFMVQTCSFFRKMVKIQKIRPSRVWLWQARRSAPHLLEAPTPTPPARPAHGRAMPSRRQLPTQQLAG